MCMICIEYQKQKLTLTEAFRNYEELKDFLDKQHSEEVFEMLYKDFESKYLGDKNE